MHALGTHLLLELKDCNSEFLNDLKKIEEILVGAAKEAKATIVKTFFHKFSPFGISGVIVIAESHFAIHTWPEYNYAAVDIFTCGDVLKPEVGANYMIEKFQSKSPSLFEVKRGILSPLSEVKLPHKPMDGMEMERGYERSEELQMVH